MLYEWILQEREQKKKVSGDMIYRKAEQMWPLVYPEVGTTPTFTSPVASSVHLSKAEGVGC